MTYCKPVMQSIKSYIRTLQQTETASPTISPTIPQLSIYHFIVSMIRKIIVSMIEKSYDRKIKSVVFGRFEGTNKRGRPHKEWMDYITEWCGASIQELYHAALEKQKWRRIMRTASGTCGHWSLG